ncbi:MAG: hypothetical protein HY328_02650 [Chloroflexi bacterium]|nr:hypothetical protein [Chloroflexota bacterium]
MAFSALLAEYKAMRDASVSRDTVRGSLENFMMLFLSAAVVGLPAILVQQQYLLLSALSLIFSTIALAYMSQARLISELAMYENEVLRPQLLKLLLQGRHSEKPPEGIDEVWQWQSYLHKKRLRGYAFFRIGRMHIDLTPLFVVGSIGFLLLFMYYRGLTNLALPELAVFLLACLGCLWLVLALIQLAIEYKGTYP